MYYADADVPALERVVRQRRRTGSEVRVLSRWQLYPAPTLPLHCRVCVEALLAFALQNTSSSREWMAAHPEQRLPSDYRRFPGKMDHTTCLAFRCVV